MKIKPSLLVFTICLLVFPAFINFVQASYLVSSTITYLNIAPATYQVTLHAYRDCNGPAAGPVENIEIKAPGCNAGRFIALNLTNTRILRNPFCATAPFNCNPGMLAFQLVQYQGIVTFSTAEQTCSDWVISFNYGNSFRQQTENVVIPAGMYNETFLKLESGILNSSPQINSMDDPIAFFCYMRQAQYIFNATDPDCDSLSYELVAPLAGPNTPVTYKPHGVVAGSIVFNPSPNPPFSNPSNPQIAYAPNLGTHYSPTFPLQSYLVNWGSQPTGTITPWFKLNSKLGILNFIPATYNPNTAASTTNKYYVTVQINEWRKVNGVIKKIGFIRREFVFKIEDCGGNNLPHITPPVIPGHPFPADSIYTVQEGSVLNLQFTTFDQDPNDILSIESDVTTVLPGATFNLSSAAKPVGNINWLATLSPNCDQVRYFNIRVADNFCPFRGRNDFLIGVKVIKNPLSVSENLNTKSSLTAFPNPFSNEITFRLNEPTKAETITIYNLLGQQIEEIAIPKNTSAGHSITWQSADKHAAGTYVAKLISEDKTIQTLKFTKLQ
ncbi:T9SS type A sorting domain-containing protein [Adhaeribacter sp. BT258]|uniref:T9SS type A sorting domain-containing protein n=1 Tax=Adhaeribacter terrigena TaxID=2793070 RepID=A0ABS1C3M4_9BACT|nr:T9SS type A sorting domain-containing protein [Adhaeribacter terrigena]MBK0403989.1 T9SS type A sorting domain-containing protein [Adhaeribacter terrigena]